MRSIKTAAIFLLFALAISLPFAQSAEAATKPQKVYIGLDGAAIEKKAIDIVTTSSLDLDARVVPSNASQTVIWECNNTAVATVDSATGVITPLKAGTATIRVTAKGTTVRDYFSLKVTDSAIPKSITVPSRTLTMYAGQTLTIDATALPTGSHQELKWGTSSSSIASVNAAGLVTARKKGTATITVGSAYNSAIKTTVKVVVSSLPAPSSISLSPNDASSLTLAVGAKLQLTAVPSPSGTSSSFLWKSSNTAKATVSSSGLVTAKAAGTAVIYVASADKTSIASSVKVTVVNPAAPTAITLNESDLVLSPKTSANLKADVAPNNAVQSVAWTTSSSSIATVSSSGTVTGVNVGTTYVTARSTYDSNVKAVAKVTVKALSAPNSISVTAPSDTVVKGKTIQLTASVSPSGASGSVKWSSSSTTRATVSTSGLVTAKAGGTVVITAASTLDSSVKGTFTLYVEDPTYPKSIVLSDESPVLLDTLQAYALDASVLPATASQSLNWASSKTAVATVSSAGVVTAKANGTAVITAYSAVDSSVKASITVQVAARSAPAKMAVTAESTDLLVGKSMKLNVTTTPTDASQLFTYASSNTSAATVDAYGNVVGKAVGKAVITVTSKKNTSVKASITINVYSSSAPNKLTLSTYSVMMGSGDTVTIAASVFPSTAPQSVTYKTSNSSVAAVSASGLVTAKNVGTATVTVTTSNGKLSATVSITVIQTVLTTTMPSCTTSVSGISANVAKIEAVKRSAFTEVYRLMNSSVITKDEADDRIVVITRAFKMMNFPWMTATSQSYWSSSSVQYTPGIVYYGMPYTQTNRQYNEIKATNYPTSASEKYFYKSGNGYYMMSRKNFVNGSYVGNDCSSFVSMSEFGTDHSASYLNTRSMAVSTYYKTISSWDSLRPGDVFVDAGHHTIMFLYYANSAKTKFVTIEQGGGTEPNTVAIRIKLRTYLDGQGYAARRKYTYK